MAAANLLALLDDITTVLDDVAVMTKLAAKKTAGVLGDDLALNAQQVSGIQAEREIPVILAVAKGSFKNKLILVPTALALSAFAPKLIPPLLMLGGGYLVYEGFEKIYHKLFHSHAEEVEEQSEEQQVIAALNDPEVDMVAFEKEKIDGAVRTDFVLSAEIIVIALGSVAQSSFAVQAAVVTGIAVLMTIGVYGFVAAIIKLDDLGLYLTAKSKANSLMHTIGEGLVNLAPYLMRVLSVLGTAAMFLVGGSIIMHGLPHSHEFIEHAV
ncbi:MAG: DUF808 domain-containing protein, partial [Thiotrichaceae bacterium]